MDDTLKTKVKTFLLCFNEATRTIMIARGLGKKDETTRAARSKLIPFIFTGDTTIVPPSTIPLSEITSLMAANSENPLQGVAVADEHYKGVYVADRTKFTKCLRKGHDLRPIINQATFTVDGKDAFVQFKSSGGHPQIKV